MKKIFLICMALVLALGALGASYAAWKDTVVMKQTVTTGTLEAGIFAVQQHFEEKDICKVDVTHGDFKFAKLVDPVPGSALFDPGVHNFYTSATIDITDFYPSFYILEDFVIGVGGTVPVKLHLVKTVVDPDGIYANMYISWVIYKVSGGIFDIVFNGTGVGSDQFDLIVAALEGYQLHGCETLIIYLDKYLEQTAPQGKAASVTFSVEAIQYNKY